MTTKVKIEFELGATYNRIVDMWIEKITLPIRINRHLVPGSWKLEIEDTDLPPGPEGWLS